MSSTFNVDKSLADHFEAINAQNTDLYSPGYIVSSNRLNMVLYGQTENIQSSNLVRILGDDMLANVGYFAVAQTVEDFKARLMSYFRHKRQQLDELKGQDVYRHLYEAKCSASGIVSTDSGFLMAFSFGCTSIYGRNLQNNICFELTKKQTLYNRYSANEYNQVAKMASINRFAAVNLFGPHLYDDFLSQVFPIPKGIFTSFLICSNTFDKSLSDVNLRAGYLDMFQEAHSRCLHDPLTALFLRSSIFAQQGMSYPSVASPSSFQAPSVYSVARSSNTKIIYNNGVALIPPKDVEREGKLVRPAEIMASPRSIAEAGTQLISLRELSRAGLKEAIDDSVSGEISVKGRYLDLLLDQALGQSESFDSSMLDDSNLDILEDDKVDTDEFAIDPSVLSASHQYGPTEPTQHLSANMFSGLKSIKPPVRPVGNLSPAHTMHGYAAVDPMDREVERESRSASPINQVSMVNGKFVPKS